MPRDKLIGIYMMAHTNWPSHDIQKFLAMLGEVNVMNILRYARKYREKLGIRDEFRQQLAEEEKRHIKEQPVLEPQSDCHDPRCGCPICYDSAEQKQMDLMDALASGN